MKTVDFSETIAASDLKVSRSIHLIEYTSKKLLHFGAKEEAPRKKGKE